MDGAVAVAAVGRIVHRIAQYVSRFGHAENLGIPSAAGNHEEAFVQIFGRELPKFPANGTSRGERFDLGHGAWVDIPDVGRCFR